MAYVADFSVWDSENTAGFFANNAADEETNFDFTPGKFALAPTQQPGRFAAELFSSSSKGFPSPLSLHMGPAAAAAAAAADCSRGAFAMKKGTTTLAFIYKGGIIVAVDSRASMGTLISSQTVKKVIEISDVILG
ncbi:proteasome subunit beta type 5, putative [Eimeria brunetti]|uniref:Proteasome subunit beta type 5, putative n=1 Tax=Eimeria brunetti TaxID=51314 RepID=U6LWL1_9EIME|nr:proteasome subunit beta type 5, putative [Eimeria brunetti]